MGGYLKEKMFFCCFHAGMISVDHKIPYTTQKQETVGSVIQTIFAVFFIHEQGSKTFLFCGKTKI